MSATRRGLLGGTAAVAVAGVAHAQAWRVPVILTTTAPLIYNRYAPMPTWLAARARVLAGTARARILFIGDSTMLGQASGTGAGNLTGARMSAVPAQVAAKLATAGLPTTRDNLFGTGNVRSLNTVPNYYPAISEGAGWTIDSTTELGGFPYLNTTTTNALGFTPLVPVDTFEVWAITHATLGVLNFNVDGSAPASGPSTFNTGIGDSFQKLAAIKAASVGTHTLNVSRASGSVYIGGLVAYDSSTPAVDVINAGWGASTTSASSGWANTSFAWDPANAISAFAPDLTIIELSNNDTWAGLTAAQSSANLTTIIGKAKLSGDVILCVPHAFQAGFGGAADTLAAQAALRQAIIALARTNNLRCIDWPRRYGSWNQANAAGWMVDGAHGNAAMYADKASVLAPLLLQ